MHLFFEFMYYVFSLLRKYSLVVDIISKFLVAFLSLHISFSVSYQLSALESYQYLMLMYAYMWICSTIADDVEACSVAAVPNKECT